MNADGLAVNGGKLYAATMDGLLVRTLADDTTKWETRGAAAPGRDVTAVRIAGAETWVASRRGIGINLTR